MGRDFYNMLGLNKSASENEIRKAYKKMAMKYHPDRNPDNKEEATKKFKEISEAYEILSNPEKKKLFDQFGEEGVNPSASGMGGGGMGGHGGFGGGFSDQHAKDIFESFFGGRGGGGGMGGMFGGFGGGRGGGMSFGDDDEEMGMGGGMPSGFSFGGMPGGFGGMGGGFGKRKARSSKPPTVQHDLFFSLEELFVGLTKKVKITRKVINDDGQSMRQESEVKAFDIKPGWKSGTKITFENSGDKPSKDAPAGDIVFVVQEKPHEIFKREGDDLLHTANISLKDALCGGSYSLKHLDGTTLRVPLSNVISPGSVTTISGKGMPISRNPTQKGNLRISFNVIFPSRITENQKNELNKIL